MKSISLKKSLYLLMVLMIVVGTALTAAVVNAYVPEEPTSVSGMWYNGETKFFVYRNIAIGLGYSESYVLNAFGNPVQVLRANETSPKLYAYSNVNMWFQGGKLIKMQSAQKSFQYLDYSLELNKYLVKVGICTGATREDARKAAVSYLGNSVKSKYPYGDNSIEYFWDDISKRYMSFRYIGPSNGTTVGWMEFGTIQ